MERLLDRLFGGHLNLGPITVYGRNAMHWGVNVWTKRWGYVCFRLPLRCFGRWWPLYFYVSPNATPWASTYFLGRRHSRGERRRAAERRRLFGHRFDTDKHSSELARINGYAEAGE